VFSDQRHHKCAKSLSLRNLSLLTNLEKLFTDCRVGQLILLGGHFEKARFNGDLFGGTGFIAPDVLFKTTKAGAQKKHRGYPDRCTSRKAVTSHFMAK